MKKDYETIEFEIIDFEKLGISTDGDDFGFNSGDGNGGNTGDWDI